MWADSTASGDLAVMDRNIVPRLDALRSGWPHWQELATYTPWRILRLEVHMPTVAEQMADLDRRIPYLRLNDLLRMGDGTIAKLRAQREALARQICASK